MYKHKFFENRAELLAWLNENHITPDNIIEILPMPTSGNGYHREYELFYFEANQTQESNT
jgi:hypothetical protein